MTFLCVISLLKVLGLTPSLLVPDESDENSSSSDKAYKALALLARLRILNLRSSLATGLLLKM